MEALVAIGLAGNVVQFVQFAGSIISKAAEIRSQGSLSSIKELQKDTKGVNQQAQMIKAHLASHEATLNTDEKVMRKLKCFGSMNADPHSSYSTLR